MTEFYCFLSNLNREFSYIWTWGSMLPRNQIRKASKSMDGVQYHLLKAVPRNSQGKNEGMVGGVHKTGLEENQMQ